MQLKPEATQEHVTEAIRLFKVSTMSAATAKTVTEMGVGALQHFWRMLLWWVVQLIAPEFLSLAPYFPQTVPMAPR